MLSSDMLLYDMFPCYMLSGDMLSYDMLSGDMLSYVMFSCYVLHCDMLSLLVTTRAPYYPTVFMKTQLGSTE